MPIIQCNICNDKFYARPAHVKMGWGKYCSKICHYQSMKSGRLLKCFICKKEIYKSLTKIGKSKSKKYFCSKSCQTKWRNVQYIGPKHMNWKDGRYAYRSILSRHKIYPKCSHCGIKDKRVLAIHHIDENHFNNDLKNLAWICHNCHYLVHHDKVEKKAFLVKIA